MTDTQRAEYLAQGQLARCRPMARRRRGQGNIIALQLIVNFYDVTGALLGGTAGMLTLLMYQSHIDPDALTLLR